MEWGETIYTGLFLQKEQPSLDQLEPVLEDGPMHSRELPVTSEQSDRIFKRMM